MLAAALALFGPVWIETPTAFLDLANARYTMNEVAAVGAGLTPLHDFFPQYTFLLGFPVAPLIAKFPSNAVGISLSWMLALQVVTVVSAIGVVVWSAGRRFLGPAALIVPSVVFAAGSPGLFSFSYFPDNPIRTVLPVLSITAACVILNRPRLKGWVAPGALIALGGLSGLAALNNPEFGVPVVVVVWAAALLSARDRRTRLHGLVGIPAGAVSVFALYGICTSLVGKPVDWSGWLLFPSLFGGDGYMNVPMDALGWHVGGATLFATGTIIGWLLVRSARGMMNSRQRRHGLALLLVSGWSLLTLPYFAGRSLAPTFLGGYALQIGWTTACLLPLIAAAWRISRRARSRQVLARQVSLALGVLAIGVCATMLTFVPGTTFDARPKSALTATQTPDLEKAIADGPARLRLAVDANSVEQLLAQPTVTQFETGIASAAVFNSPEYFGLSPELVARQCARLAQTESRFVIVLPDSAAYLKEDATCQAALDFQAGIRIGTVMPDGTGGFLAVPRRHTS